MLIKPVQRVTRYPLLFDDLLSCTTPVHPDYFAIRTSAEMARILAVEIDEAKRRKDVVANAIAPTKSMPAPSPAKERPTSSRGKGMKMFWKEKANGSSVTLAMSVSTSEMGAPPDIPSSSLSQLKELIARVEESEQIVRRVGKEMILWTAGAKNVFTVQDEMINTWSRAYRLGGPDIPESRLPEFQRLLEYLVADAWATLVGVLSHAKLTIRMSN